MNKVGAEKVINGTFGELWINGEYMAETIALEAKVSLEKTEVNQCGTLAKGYKITGIEGKGTVKLNKVSSYFITLLSENIKAGKTTSVTIISKLADPDSLGTERIQLNNCIFDELTLANWEAKKLGEESVAFTFSDWDVLEEI